MKGAIAEARDIGCEDQLSDLVGAGKVVAFGGVIRQSKNINATLGNELLGHTPGQAAICIKRFLP
jgi:hypothetical protein